MPFKKGESGANFGFETYCNHVKKGLREIFSSRFFSILAL
jgi:hypothetical protein